MDRKLVAGAMVALLAAPLSIAGNVPNPVIPPTDVGPGETRMYRDLTYVVVGEIRVHPGGTLVIDRATFLFTAASPGITVLSGGSLRIDDSALLSHADLGDLQFRVSLANGTKLTWKGSTLEGARGLTSGADDAVIEGGRFRALSEGVHFIGGSATVTDSRWTDMPDGLRADHGAYVVERSSFADVNRAVHLTGASASIDGIEIDHAFTGVTMVASDVSLLNGRLMENAEPLSVGAHALQGSDVAIVGNRFEDWGRAIVVEGSTARIEDNTILRTGSHAIDSTSPALLVLDNTIDDAGGAAVVARGAGDANITGNVINDTHQPIRVYVDGAADVVSNRIRNDSLVDTAWVVSVYVQNASTARILGNDILTPPVYAMQVYGTGSVGGTEIAGNAIEKTPATSVAATLFVGGAHALELHHNDLLYGTFYVYSSAGAQIHNNTLRGPAGAASLFQAPGARLADNVWWTDWHGPRWLAVFDSEGVSIERDSFDGVAAVFTDSPDAAVRNVTSVRAHVTMIRSDDARIEDSAIGHTGCAALGLAQSLRALVRNVAIQFAAGSSHSCSWYTALHVTGGGDHVFEDIEVRGAAYGPGIILDGSTGNALRNSTLAQNAVADVRSTGGSGLTARATSFLSAGAIANEDAAALDLRHNWWGHASGPQHASNPGGAGGSVAGAALLSPWLTTPP